MTALSLVPDTGQLPVCLEAEQALLGAILVNNAAAAHVQFLRPEHFGEALHGAIHEAILATLAEGRVANPITLRARIAADVELAPGMTVAAYLARLAAEATTVINARAYADMIHDFWIRRRLIDSARDIEAQARAVDYPIRPAAIASDAIGALHQLAEGHAQAVTRVEAHAGAGALIERVQAIRAGQAGDEAAPTGFADLDRDTGGYRAGTLWVVAARPGMGKTAFLTASARRVAQAGHGVLAFSMEVPAEEIHARYLADLSYIAHKPLSFGAIMRGQIDDEDLWRLRNAAKRLGEMPLVSDVASRLSVAEIAMRVRAEKERMAKRGRRLGVIFVDYLKFVQASDRYRGQRVYEVGEISAGLKQLAKDEGLCVVLLAQLNRAVEARDDKRPGLSDLRESGDLEADAHVVAFIYREAYYIERSADYRANKLEALEAADAARNRLELILGKNRAGPAHTVGLWCDVAASSVASHSR